jgi:membrane fusion protein, heavy metal efflux system
LMILHHAGNRYQELEKKWARVVLKAPMSGIILERNLEVGDTVTDNTLNLFQIADVRRLLVIVTVPEDQIATLRDAGRKWTVLTVGAPGDGIPGTIDDIGYLIDPNQHGVMAKGYIDNAAGRLRGGQFVTAEVEIPAPDDVVEIPLEALIDDANQTLVFVQTDAPKMQYTLQRVKVAQRLAKTAFVKKAFSPAERKLLDSAWLKTEKEEGLYPVAPLEAGAKVLTIGVFLLKKELQEQEAGGRK